MTKEEIIALGVPEDIAEKVLTQHTAELNRPSSSERYTIIKFNSHAHTERDLRTAGVEDENDISTHTERDPFRF